MALNSSSYPSTSPSSSAALLRRPCASRSTRSRFDLSFPFCNPERTKRLAVRSQAADRDPTNLSPLSSNGISKSDTCATNEATNASPSSSSSAAVIDFLTLCHRLKTTKRKGWINHGIKGPESIADHMYRMALMALVAGDIPDLDRERCIKIAIVHDIAEAIVGDITPSDGVPKEEKTRMEQAALNEMCKILGGGLRAEELQELWAEYENNSSMEASLVKDFDKVELILQALEYEIEHGKVLDEFFLSTAGKFQTEIGRRWAAEVTSRRNVRLGNRQVT